MRPYFKKPFTKIGLVEWLKVNALSSCSSTEKKKNTQNVKTTKKTLLSEQHKLK
jgi:hypothetical protein